MTRTAGMLVFVVAFAGCGSDSLGGWWGLDAAEVVSGTDTGSLPKPDAADQDTTTGDSVSGFLPDTTGLSGLSCKDFYRLCVSQCPVGTGGEVDEPCFEACRQTLSAGGSTVVDAFQGCLDNSGCGDEADEETKWSCYASKCDDAYYACFHGTGDCSEVLACIQSCPQGDGYGTCVVECSQDGEVAAQKHLVKVLQCIGDNCCPVDAAQCSTAAGQQCAKDVFQLGGACFLLGTACVTGTY